MSTTYTLSPAALVSINNAGRNTLQRPAAGLGKAWRSAGFQALSIRGQCLVVLFNLPSPFTAAQAAAALVEAGVQLGCSGSATTRVSKFVRSGHLVAVAPAATAPATAPAAPATAPAGKGKGKGKAAA